MQEHPHRLQQCQQLIPRKHRISFQHFTQFFRTVAYSTMSPLYSPYTRPCPIHVQSAPHKAVTENDNTTLDAFGSNVASKALSHSVGSMMTLAPHVMTLQTPHHSTSPAVPSPVQAPVSTSQTHQVQIGEQH
jgi:hypothetical protein